MTDYDVTTTTVLHADSQGIPAVVTCHAAHAIVTASCDPSLRDQVNSFELVCPDGQPVRWALNLLYGTRVAERVYGPELMLRLCRGASEFGIPIYLYGGSPVVAKRLEVNLLRLYPTLRIAGCEAPPFR